MVGAVAFGADAVPLTLRATGGRPGSFVAVQVSPDDAEAPAGSGFLASATEEGHSLQLRPGTYRVCVEALVFRTRRKEITVEVLSPTLLEVSVGLLGLRLSVRSQSAPSA